MNRYAAIALLIVFLIAAKITFVWVKIALLDAFAR